MPRFYLDMRAHRESAAAGQTPFTPAIAVVYQVDEGIRLMQAGGQGRRLRPPRGVRRGLAGRPPGARLRAVRRRALRLADGDRGEAARGPRLEGVQRRDQGPRRRPRRRPGQAHRQDLPARPPRLGHGRGDPRRDRGPRDGSALEQGRRISPGAAVGAAQAAALAVQTRSASPAAGTGSRGRRRRPRVRILVAEPIAAEGVARLRAHHEVDERPGLSPRRALRDPARATTRSIVRSQVQVDAAVIVAAGQPPPGHRPGRRRRRQRRPRGGDARPGSRSSTPRPATRSRPRSTRSRCSTASPARSRPPTRPSGAASGSGPSSPASSCAAGRSASSGSARSARRSRPGRGRWR